MKSADIRIMSAEKALKYKLLGMMEARPGMFGRLDTDYSNALYVKKTNPQRVQIIANGGGGYGPLYSGFIGPGLADATCEGNFDTAPNAYALYELAKILGSEQGVLFIANNFAGDFLNNDMALELLRGEGIEAMVLYANDDIMSAQGEPREMRGGLHGTATLVKIAACAAEALLPLNEVYRIAGKANDNQRSISVQLNPATRKIEFGTGFSGEPPVHVIAYENVEQLAELTLTFLIKELAPDKNKKIYITLNKMNEMSYTEAYGLLHLLRKNINKDFEVGGSVCGAYFDAYEGNGFMLSLLSADDELQKYIRYVSGYDFAI